MGLSDHRTIRQRAHRESRALSSNPPGLASGTSFRESARDLKARLRHGHAAPGPKRTEIGDTERPDSEDWKPVDGVDREKTRAVRWGRKTGKSTRSVPLPLLAALRGSPRAMRFDAPSVHASAMPCRSRPSPQSWATATCAPTQQFYVDLRIAGTRRALEVVQTPLLVPLQLSKDELELWRSQFVMSNPTSRSAGSASAVRLRNNDSASRESWGSRRPIHSRQASGHQRARIT